MFKLTEKVKETRKYKVLHKTYLKQSLHPERFRCIEISVIIAK